MKKNKILKMTGIIITMLYFSNCASFVLREPVNKKTGGVAITLYMTMLKGQLFESNHPIYDARLMEKQADGSYKELPENQTKFLAPEFGDHGSWGPHHVFVNLDPDKTYALSYVYTQYTISGYNSTTTVQIPVNFNPKVTERIITFKPEAGKIKYYGIHMIDRVVLEEGNLFQGRAADIEFQIKPGLAHLKKIFLHALNGQIFGFESRDEKGAEKRLIKALLVEGKSTRWHEIMKERLKKI